jgi:hypothetical protein
MIDGQEDGIRAMDEFDMENRETSLLGPVTATVRDRSFNNSSVFEHLHSTFAKAILLDTFQIF